MKLSGRGPLCPFRQASSIPLDYTWKLKTKLYYSVTRKKMPKHSDIKGPTQRQLRVGEMIRHAFTDILTRMEFIAPGIDSQHVTVTEVRVSPDLRNATIYTLPFGNGDAAQLCEALSRHQKYLRGELAKRVNLKYMPNLSFQIDDSFEKANRIDQLLQSPSVKRDLG